MYNNSNKNFYFIIEEAYTPVDNTKIIKEEKLKNGKYKLIFKTILQEADVRNNNKRIYPKNVLQEVVEKLSPKAKQRALFGELDHPWIDSSDELLLKRRASQVRLSESCVLFRNIEFDGKYVIAECETLTTSKGLDLFALLKDNANIGFSLRAFGPVKPDTVTNTLIVQPGINPITYDVVSNPSHSNARILEFLNEDINIFIPFDTSSNDKIYVFMENTIDELSEPKKQQKLEEIKFTNVPFGAIINDLQDDTLMEDLLGDNPNVQTVSIKIDSENNQVVICKNDKCIFTSIDDLIDNILDQYFDDNDDNDDDEINDTNDMDNFIQPGNGRRILGLPPIRYVDPLKCRYQPIINNLFDSTHIIESKIKEEQFNENTESECSNYNCPICEDIEFVEFVSEIDESKIDSLLKQVYNDDFDLFEDFEVEYIDVNEFNDIEIDPELIDDELNESAALYEELNNDEPYLQLSYKDYMEQLVNEITNEIEKEVNPPEEEVIDNYNKVLNETIEELNNIPDILYELSLIDDIYEQSLTEDIENNENILNEKKLDILLNKIMEEEYNTLKNMVREIHEKNTLIEDTNNETHEEIIDFIVEDTFYKEFLV